MEEGGEEKSQRGGKKCKKFMIWDCLKYGKGIFLKKRFTLGFVINIWDKRDNQKSTMKEHY